MCRLLMCKALGTSSATASWRAYGQTFPAIASRALAVLLSVVVARAREAGKLARVLVSNHQSHKGKV